MPKMSTELKRTALNGPTMGTRWSALFYARQSVDPKPIRDALQSAVDEVDAQMSIWKPDSELMRLNAGPVAEWIAVPNELMQVLALGLEIGRATDGAFDVGTGHAVRAWGFGPAPADQHLIRQAAAATGRPAAHEVLELDPDGGRARKRAPVALDLNGIAKGYGVDRLAETLRHFGISSGLVGIDGELRALGLRPDGQPWTIAVEAPDFERRSLHSVLCLQDAAAATSGDYRHWTFVEGRRLSHTFDPRRGVPLLDAPASVTVVARTSAEADAWATALMVLGPETGSELAQCRGLNALFLLRDSDGGILKRPVGTLFSGQAFPASEREHVS